MTRFNFDVLASGERLRSFDSLRQCKRYLKNNPELKAQHNHLYTRDNKNSANSRFLFAASYSERINRGNFNGVE